MVLNALGGVAWDTAIHIQSMADNRHHFHFALKRFCPASPQWHRKSYALTLVGSVKIASVVRNNRDNQLKSISCQAGSG